MASKRSVLITGCSKGGLGDVLARAFHTRGLRVIATARNPSKIEHLKPLGIETLTLDVTSQESIKTCIQEVSNLTGGSLDILLNNSGGGCHLPLIDVSIDAAREAFDLNVWSVLSMVQAFMPLLLKSSYGGMIVNNTSVASVAAVPLQGIYNASKAAAASLTEALRLELQPFGIKVVDMKTGAVRSEFYANMSANVKDKTGGPLALPNGSMYEVARKEIDEILRGDTMETRMVDPNRWAEQVVGDLMRDSPPATVWRGGSANMVWFGAKFFPAFLWDRFMRAAGGLDIVNKRLKEQREAVKPPRD
jgi:1-acylglycerone phosphate reductase